MEILHSSAVEATELCIVSIYAYAENKAAEFFSQLSTSYDKRVQLSLSRVHKACHAETLSPNGGQRFYNHILYSHFRNPEKFMGVKVLSAVLPILFV